MRIRLATLAMLLPIVLPAQGFVRVGGGLTGSTDFLKDFLVQPISARQSIAPTVTALVGWRMRTGHRLGVEARYALGNWEVVEDDYTDDLGALRTLNLMLWADGPITGPLRWEATAGVIRYQPGRETGPFSAGAPSPWTAGAGVSWTRSLTTTLDLVMGARYDYHGFNTRRLDADGYASRQSVHRAGVTVSVERGF